MSKRRIVFILGIAVSLVGLWWAFSGVEWSEVARSFSSLRLYVFSIPFVIVTIASMWFRAARTHYLLRHEASIPTWPLFRITMIGFCYNCILPARAGEIIRAYLLGRQRNLGLGRGAACLVVERIYDLIMLMLCFLGALMSVTIAPNLEVEVFGSPAFRAKDIKDAAALSGRLITGQGTLEAYLRGRLSPEGRKALFDEPEWASDPARLRPVLARELNLFLRDKSLYEAKRFEAAPLSEKTKALVAAAKAQTQSQANVAQLNRLLLEEAFAGQINPSKRFTLKGSYIAPLTRKLVYLCVLLMAGIAFMLFEKTRSLVIVLINLMAFVPHSFRKRLSSLVESFSSGLRSVRDPRTVAWVLFTTFLVWLTVALSLWVMQFGFQGLGRVSLSASFAITILICFAVMLPSGPSYFGMYEAGGIFSLLILGITQDRSLALSYTLAIHLLQIIPIIILGLFYAYQDHVSIRKIQEQAQ